MGIGRRERFPGEREPSSVLTLILVVALAASLGGCAPKSEGMALQTTMLTSVDLVRMTDEMAVSLLNSGVELKDRIVVTDRVVNRTNHIIDAGEKELFLAKLRVTLAQNPTIQAMGVVFVARPDELPEIAPQGKGAGPTHALTATFYTLTQVTRSLREDAYACAFQLQDLRTREVVWEDAYEVRYAVERGKLQ